MDSKWTQIGGDIKGKAKYDSLGQKIEISDDGSTIALGTSSGKGSLIVYRNINNSWTEVMKIEGERVGSMGSYFSLSADGSTIATGDPYDPDIDNKGKVQVFNVPDPYAPTLLSSSPSDNATNYIEGGDGIVLNFSEAVDVETGNILIKKTSDDSTVETIDVTSDQVTGSGTTQITINPSVDLASSTEYYIQIPATAFDDASGNSYAGISDKTSLSFTTASFKKIGGDIIGEATYDSSGKSISLSADGSVIAIGASSNDGKGTSSGHVRIYKNNNGSWQQIGNDIDGEAKSDYLGQAISLSADGSVIALGAQYNDGNGSFSGHVRIYKNNNGSWQQIGSDIDGEAARDYFGRAVSLSSDGSVVAIGAYANDGNGNISGTVFETYYDNTAPSVSIISPESGASLDIGDNVEIIWDSSDDYGLSYTNIYYRNGQDWNLIADDLANVNSFSWFNSDNLRFALGVDGLSMPFVLLSTFLILIKWRVCCRRKSISYIIIPNIIIWRCTTRNRYCCTPVVTTKSIVVNNNRTCLSMCLIRENHANY